MGNQTLVGEVMSAMERYRQRGTPGVYVFAAEIVDGAMSGRIIEERYDYTDPAEIEMFGVSVGFWPNGFPPVDAPTLQWFHTHPFLKCVKDLERAPVPFLEQLKRYLDSRESGKEVAWRIFPPGEVPPRTP